MTFQMSKTHKLTPSKTVIMLFQRNRRLPIKHLLLTISKNIKECTSLHLKHIIDGQRFNKDTKKLKTDYLMTCQSSRIEIMIMILCQAHLTQKEYLFHLRAQRRYCSRRKYRNLQKISWVDKEQLIEVICPIKSLICMINQRMESLKFFRLR